MHKIFIIILIIYSYIYAKDIQPSFVLESSGFVNDFVLDGAKLYVANDEGSVEIFDLNDKKLIGEIFIKPTLSAQGIQIPSKILSVDRLNGKTLIVSTTANAYRNVWLHDGDKLHHIKNIKDKMTIKKARFIDEKNYLFGTLGYDMIRYAVDDSAHAYKVHVEQSSFSDMVLSEDKKLSITASESGQVTVSDVKTGKILKKYDSLNVDNIYKIAYKNGTIITAGQDRRVGVYPKDGKPYYIKSDFLVYCASLSPSGKVGVYSSGTNSNLQLFDVKNGTKTDRLIGHTAIPSTIKFFDEIGLFSAGYENKIFYWHLD
jgi:WD40 repeat protein